MWYRIVVFIIWPFIFQTANCLAQGLPIKPVKTTLSAEGDTTVPGKKIIDSSIFETTSADNIWPKIEGADLSKDGNYVNYVIKNSPSPGQQELVFQSTNGQWEQSFVTKGYSAMSGNGKWAIIAMSKDSIILLRLGTSVMTTIDHILSYETDWDGSGDWLAYIHTSDSILTLFDLNTGLEKRFGKATDFHFSPTGRKLVWQTFAKDSSDKKYSLYWMMVANGESQKLDEDSVAFNLGSFVFDSSETALALVKVNCLWYYQEGRTGGDLLAGPSTHEFPANMHISSNGIIFSNDGHRLLFNLEENPFPSQNALPEGAVHVDVWRYSDNPDQAAQLGDPWTKQCYPATVNINTRTILYLGAQNKHFDDPKNGNSHVLKYLLCTDATGTTDYWWHKDNQPSVYVISTQDGASKTIKSNIKYFPDGNYPKYMEFTLSPLEEYVLYYDPLAKCYYSYNTQTSKTETISRSIQVSLTNNESADKTNNPIFQHPAGIVGWLKEDKGVLISDNYDIWLLDLSGEHGAVDITKGYGRKHHIVFALEGKRPRVDIISNIPLDSDLLLTGYDETNKYEAFYKISLNKVENPEQISKGPYWYSDLNKGGNTWLFFRQSTCEAPNLFSTQDFRTVHALTNLQPQREYNWLSAELVNYNLPDGRPCQGILYKPENFNSTKKYPVIFYLYEKLTQELFQFQEPGLPWNIINIPVYLNKGYLIFLPDIWYKVGYPGQGALESLETAARLLSRRSYVDAKHMGLQGHSWGAYETYYIISHSHLFAAAVAGDGPCDFISGYGSPRGNTMPPAPHMYEMSQNRIGATPWQRLDLYIQNSPVLQADKIKTPLLMQHSKKDWLVNFDQGMELFTALRRMDKKVWLLQYDDGLHGTSLRKDAVDFSIRMEQFFNHYLKGAPAPVWMTRGIPAIQKGWVTGYQLDLSGRQP